MKVLSLFAGIGGLDLGFEAHGCETVAYSEIEPYACRVMEARFPGAVNLGDITEIDWADAPDIDIICGGFPCQDISLAGKGAGIEGERSGLWSYYSDAIRELRPRGVLVENVAALANRGLDRVLGSLADCGYDAEWDCIPAAAVGAPHLRDRMFIVAYRPDDQRGSGEGDGGSSEARSYPERDGVEQRRADGDVAGEAGAREGEGNQRQWDGDAAFDLRAASPDADHERREELDRAALPVGAQVPADRGPRGDAGWPVPRPSYTWRVEPGMGRMVDGIPHRMDRLRCLGNAVVPQVAEHVAGILLDRIGGAE